MHVAYTCIHVFIACIHVAIQATHRVEVLLAIYSKILNSIDTLHNYIELSIKKCKTPKIGL